MSSNHSLFLTVKTAFWAIVIVVLLFFPKPSPWLLILVGATLGVAGGTLQSRILQETPNALDTAGPIEQNPAVFDSKRGKSYLAFFWSCNVAFVVLSLIFKIHWLIGYFAGAAAFELIRGLLVFKNTGQN